MSFLPADQRETLLTELAAKHRLTRGELEKFLAGDWRVVGRDKQQPPAWAWTYWAIVSGRGFGKAICVETPLPTPEGWRRLGDVLPGDVVFDESGRPSYVEATYDRDPEAAYRLWFSDGTHIDACSEHQWTTWRHRERKALGRSRDAGAAMPAEWPAWLSRSGAGPRVRTTQEIADTLTHGRRGDLNHSIPVCGPLDLPERDLPLDPYVLGAWLGDGSRHGSHIHAAVSDHPHWYEQLAAFRPHRVKDPIVVATYDLHSTLASMGLLLNKHVPAEYLRASPAQRLALLQGLMDTDGSAAPSSVEFTNTNYLLVRAVVELARSLGQKPVVAEGRAVLDGRDCGPKWRVTWRPTVAVFRMERKASLVRPLGSQAIRNQHRMIVGAEEIDPKPMRCLTVGSRHHTFLVGEAMIPTHNTLTGAQWAKRCGQLEPGIRFALVAPTQADVRDTMVEGETGLLSILPNSMLRGGSRESAWNRTTLELVLANGTRYKGFSSEKPDRLRGPQHHKAWCEEVASWNDVKGGDKVDTTWSNVKLSTRLGEHPQILVTTTPKPNKLMKVILSIPANRMALVKGSSYENRANLSEAWWQEVVAPYEGTRTGRQEIHGELLEDVEGALWTAAMIDALRVAEAPADLGRLAVGVDPNASTSEAANSAGVVVAGVSNSNRHGYVLADRTTVRGGPRAWAQAGVDAYHDYECDFIVAEKNQGGEMVKIMFETVDPSVPVRLVSASRGKRTRAEPIASLYERGYADLQQDRAPTSPTVHHVGAFPDLEDEMTTWTPESESPDRMDALVWVLTKMMLKLPQGRASSSVPRGRIQGVGTHGELTERR